MQANTLGGVRDEIEAQQATNAQLRQEIADLQRFEDLQVRAQAKQELLAAAFTGEASFSGLLMDMSRVIPSDAALNSLTVAVTPPTGETEVDPAAAGFVGTITTAGEAEGFDTLSTWLTRLEQVQGWVNPWMSSISRRDDTGTIYTFSSGADLTPDVLTERGRGTADEG
jgi:Tfp pilus assembly protein PilN